MANKYRAETDLEVGETTYRLKFATGELMDLEDQLGISLIEFTQNISAAKLTLRQIETVLRVGLAGAGARVPPDKVRAIMETRPIFEWVPIVGAIMATAFGLDEDEEGNADAAATIQ